MDVKEARRVAAARVNKTTVGCFFRIQLVTGTWYVRSVRMCLPGSDFLTLGVRMYSPCAGLRDGLSHCRGPVHRPSFSPACSGSYHGCGSSGDRHLSVGVGGPVQRRRIHGMQ
eukprot:725954-Pyramimonas_sp.AAC.1